MAKVRPDLAICNLSRRKPDINIPQLNLRHIACDLSDSSQVEEALAGSHGIPGALRPRGRILLINNSGFGVYGSFPEAGVAQQLEMVDVNIRAVVQLTAGLLPRCWRAGRRHHDHRLDGGLPADALPCDLRRDEGLRAPLEPRARRGAPGHGRPHARGLPGPDLDGLLPSGPGVEGGLVPDGLSETSEEVVLASLCARWPPGKAVVVSGLEEQAHARSSARGSRRPWPPGSPVPRSRISG